MNNPYDPEVQGGHIPSYWTPERAKFMFKAWEEHRNHSRLDRKELPMEVKKELQQVTREYIVFKQREEKHLDEMQVKREKVMNEAFKACFFLPDYLFEEALFVDTDESRHELKEYHPMMLYHDQMHEIFPYEQQNAMLFMPEVDHFEYQNNEMREKRKEGGKDLAKASV